MQISVVPLYLIWSLISSSMNQIIHTAPTSASQNCTFCPDTYYSINDSLTDEYYNGCSNMILCDKREYSCGIKIDKPSHMKYMQLSLGCVDKKDCEGKKVSLTDNITFADNYKSFECCNGALCNNQTASLPISALVLGSQGEDSFGSKCPGFTDNHQSIYLNEESNNKQKIKQNDNIVITYKDIDKGYIKRHELSTTWYAVFQDKDPFKEVKIASFCKDKQGKVNEVYSNSDLINKEKIFHITHEAMYLCKFNLKDLNIILNKIVTNDGHTRLFGVVLTDKDVVPHAQGIIDKIKDRHIIKINQRGINKLNKQNNTAIRKILDNKHKNIATRDILSNIIMLIPLIGVVNFN